MSVILTSISKVMFADRSSRGGFLILFTLAVVYAISQGHWIEAVMLAAGLMAHIVCCNALARAYDLWRKDEAVTGALHQMNQMLDEGKNVRFIFDEDDEDLVIGIGTLKDD